MLWRPVQVINSPQLGLVCHRKGRLRGIVSPPAHSGNLKGQFVLSKIPVFATVSRTYGFLLGEAGTIFRLAWAPILIVTGLNYLYGGQAIDAALLAKNTAATVAQFDQTGFLLGVFGFLANVRVSVALLRVVIFGDRKTGLAVYLWFGATELRLVGVYILLMVAAVAAVVGAGLVLSVFAALAAAIPGLAIVLPIAVVALGIGLIWAALKLMIIPAVVVAENSLGVERAWALMHGNALRMFFVLGMTYIPIGIAGSLVLMAILGNDMPPAPDFQALFSGKLTPDEVRQSVDLWQLGLLKAMRMHWVEISIMNFIGGIIGAALVAGLTGNTYTALAGERH